MASLLARVRQQLAHGEKPVLLDGSGAETTDVVQAVSLKLGAETWPLEDMTDFRIEGSSLPLRVVVHCWLHKESSAAEYLADCQEKNLTNVSFLQRNDLIQWLAGESDTLTHLKGDLPVTDAGKTEPTTKKRDSTSAPATTDKTTDKVLLKALDQERTLLDHNSSLRGSKPIDFGYLIKDAELKLVQPIKSSLHSRNGHGMAASSGRVSKQQLQGPRAGPRKDPIILIPSAASSLFTLSNIQKFLTDSEYSDPRSMPSPQGDLVTVEKKFDSISRPIRFIVVNNTRMFTKPEYWDRVVAVFTTGHTWQFSNYQWNTPQELFQHCKGYYFHFTGDTVPQNVQQWNVQKVELDKNKRFRDVEVVRYFWNNLEKELLARGYR